MYSEAQKNENIFVLKAIKYSHASKIKNIHMLFKFRTDKLIHIYKNTKKTYISRFPCPTKKSTVRLSKTNLNIIGMKNERTKWGKVRK